MEKLHKYRLYRKTSLNDMQVLFDLATQAKRDKTLRSLLKCRSSEVDDIRIEFLKQHNSVISALLTDPEQVGAAEAEETVREGFLNQYFATKAIIEDLFSDINLPSIQNSTQISSSDRNIRLPKINLPKFSGDYKDFSSYIDLFDALVHDNSSLSDVEKFNYLKTSLEGQPLSLVRNLKCTSDNYDIAYKSIRNRYDNKRLKAKNLWDAISNTVKVDSSKQGSLRNLLDTFTENLEALKVMGFPVGDWDFILVMMLMKRLDQETITLFEQIEHKSNEVPTYEKLFKFLESQCIALNNTDYREKCFVDSSTHLEKPGPSGLCNNNKSNNSSFRKKSPIAPHRRTSSLFVNKSPATTCIFCKADHSLYTCLAFVGKTPSERYNFCKRSKLCFNCLSASHDLKSCRSSHACKKCFSNKHHTLLHFEKNNSNNSSQPIAESTATAVECLNSQTNNLLIANETHFRTCLKSSETSSSDLVILSTASVDVLNNHHFYQPLRGLLDSGSQSSFITLKAYRQLGLQKFDCAVEVNGLGSMKSCISNGKVTLSIKPRGKILPVLYCDAIIIDKICDKMPALPISSVGWSHINNLPLADERFNRPDGIELLLGADLFSKIILPGRVLGKNGEPDAINTIFGYVFMGKLKFAPPVVSSLFCLHISLNETLRNFWEVETVPENLIVNPDDVLCEKIYRNTVTRASNGHYKVSLPFRVDNPSFPGIRELALNRFFSLEKRLLKQPELYQKYSDFMREYQELGHMELVPNNHFGEGIYYIPHHCVLKPDNASSPLRVVYDASARTCNRKSLNDCLFTGPKLQQDILTILFNFRLHNFALSTDIKQMYRMIQISTDHQDFQRIFWRFSPNEEIQEYRLTTVTYGVSSAPFLALRTLCQLVEDEGHRFPLAAKVLRTCSYIDDFIFGSQTFEEGQTLIKELTSLLELGGFQLRKWCSNEPILLSQLPPTHINPHALNFEAKSIHQYPKILGLKWDSFSDCFLFNVQPRESLDCTKRVLLSELSRVYDPVGFVSCITFFMKYLIQKLWILGVKWDEKPTPDILRLWTQYKMELPLLINLKIPRKLNFLNATRSELHAFCDASEKGYACVVYLRNIMADNNIKLDFLCSKSKVSPVKRMTIPRLELYAAVLLSKLVTFTLCTYKDIPLSKIYAWSDSQIVLHWLKNSPHKYKPFVAHRISYIQGKVSPDCWYYIDSKNNIADVASRGILPSELINLTSWFEGPKFLSHLKISFPNAPPTLLPPPLEEERNITFLAVADTENIIDTLLTSQSSFTTVQYILAFVLRFCNNLKPKSQKLTGSLSRTELYNALITIVKRTQSIYFKEELSKKSFSKPLRTLHAFLDSKGIIRVGGRLIHSSLSYEQKHPFLLPRQSRLTTLLIEYYHKILLHAGFRTTQFLLSQQFWILSPKRAINAVLSKCIVCWKTNPKPYQPPMGDLPKARISAVKPFSHSGVDFGGPFSITFHRNRGVRTVKAYLCLFVCFATKALHLELAGNLSAESFLAALQRFIARRGRVSHIYCDNGTNFIAASRELKSYMQHAAEHETIDFHFNPPSAAHFGGLWEAGIKSVKTHLVRVIGEQILTYEEFYTVLVSIESILNSRPLTPLSNDIEDINALTPGHFLTLEPLQALPVPDFTSLPLNHLSRWQLLQRMCQDFWKRWHYEYLHSLQQRPKWSHSNFPGPQEGSLVLIKDDNSRPCHWLMGRIIKLYCGPDNIARVALVRTANGTLKRPLVKLCPLPKIED